MTDSYVDPQQQGNQAGGGRGEGGRGEGGRSRGGRGAGSREGGGFRIRLSDNEMRSARALQEAFNLRFQQATNQLENTARMRAVRRDVARIKTVLVQKATEAAK